jgi:hypothetical protein
MVNDVKRTLCLFLEICLWYIIDIKSMSANVQDLLKIDIHWAVNIYFSSILCYYRDNVQSLMVMSIGGNKLTVGKRAPSPVGESSGSLFLALFNLLELVLL